MREYLGVDQKLPSLGTLPMQKARLICVKHHRAKYDPNTVVLAAAVHDVTVSDSVVLRVDTVLVP